MRVHLWITRRVRISQTRAHRVEQHEAIVMTGTGRGDAPLPV